MNHNIFLCLFIFLLRTSKHSSNAIVMEMFYPAHSLRIRSYSGQVLDSSNNKRKLQQRQANVFYCDKNCRTDEV